MRDEELRKRAVTGMVDDDDPHLTQQLRDIDTVTVLVNSGLEGSRPASRGIQGIETDGRTLAPGARCSRKFASCSEVACHVRRI